MGNIAVESSPTDGSPATLRQPLPPQHISTRRQIQLGVGMEEYMHYASISRAKEVEKNREYESKRGPVTMLRLLKDRFHKGHHEEQITPSPEIVANRSNASETQSSDEKKSETIVHNAPVEGQSDVWDAAARDAELYLASRVMRTAGWGSAFYRKSHTRRDTYTQSNDIYKWLSNSI